MNTENKLPPLDVVAQVMPNIPEPDPLHKWKVVGWRPELQEKKKLVFYSAKQNKWLDIFSQGEGNFFYLQQVHITHGLEIPKREGYKLGECRPLKGDENVKAPHGYLVYDLKFDELIDFTEDDNETIGDGYSEDYTAYFLWEKVETHREDGISTIEDLYRDGDVCYLIFPESWEFIRSYKDLKKNFKAMDLCQPSQYPRWSNRPLTKYEDANEFVV